MKKLSVKKLALAGMLCALCVVGSVFSFPMFGSKCAPIQHMVNVTCAVLLGPWWGVGVAFVASLLRNILGLGSLMAFPGSMFGALLCGLVYAKTKNLIATLVGEVFGTSILGGLCAYPVAICLMGKSAGDIAFYAYIVPFLISTAVGAVIAGVLVYSLQHSGALRSMQSSLSFVSTVQDFIGQHPEAPLKDIRLFWNRMDSRTSKELYVMYNAIVLRMGLKVFETVLPDLERFNKEMTPSSRQHFRCTLLPPSESLLKDSRLEAFVQEMERIIFPG